MCDLDEPETETSMYSALLVPNQNLCDCVCRCFARTFYERDRKFLMGNKSVVHAKKTFSSSSWIKLPACAGDQKKKKERYRGAGIA